LAIQAGSQEDSIHMEGGQIQFAGLLLEQDFTFPGPYMNALSMLKIVSQCMLYSIKHLESTQLKQVINELDF
jgi:hypothetical protein